MTVVTTQQLAFYYDHYRDTEITITNDIVKLLKLDLRQICIKGGGDQWTCILNSVSFMQCHIIVGVKGGAYTMLTDKKTEHVSIRFCFTNSDGQPITFFVNGRIQDVTPYMDSSELAIATVTFIQRPPDDFIEKFGIVFDANANAESKKNESITINNDSRRILNLSKDEISVQVQGVPRSCILRDLSFSKAHILMMGIKKFLLNQPVSIRLCFEDPTEVLLLNGTVVQADAVEGRKDILSCEILFDEKNICYPYRLRINNFFMNTKKHGIAP